jgi:hypothetical protein
MTPTPARFGGIAAGIVAGCALVVGCASAWVPPPEWTPKPQAPAAFSIVALRIEDGPLKSQLARAVELAAAADQSPYVELTSRWCRACHWLDHAMSDSTLSRTFGGTYVVRVDIDAWAGRLEGTGLDYHTGPLPAFVALSEAGRAVGDWADPRVWQSEVPREAAPVLASFFHDGR